MAKQHDEINESQHQEGEQISIASGFPYQGNRQETAAVGDQHDSLGTVQ